MLAIVRVGHRGARALAPPNSLEGFEAAWRAGVDMVEFDVARAPGGTLVLAHSDRAARRRPLPLTSALEALSRPPLDGLALNVDLKAPGFEAALVDVLGSHDLLHRCLVSARDPAALRRLGRLAPDIQRGWSLRWSRHARLLRRGTRDVAEAAREALGSEMATALMVHHHLVGPQLVQAVRGERGELYAWTVNRVQTLRRLATVGVTGLISDDPDAFARAGLRGARPPWAP